MAQPKAAHTGDEHGVAKSRVPADIRNVSFPASMRGYDRAAVDAYVRRANRVIAELEVTQSPQAAVRHAVEQVSEQTKTILEQARESAEKITDTARADGDEILAAAKAEAADLVVSAGDEADRVRAEAEKLIADARAQAEKIVGDANAEAAERRRLSEEELASLQAQAEAKMRELEADTEVVQKERQFLLDDIEGLAARLHEAASEAAARISHDAPAVADDGWPTDTEETTVLPPEPAAETLVDAPPTPRKRAASGRKKA